LGVLSTLKQDYYWGKNEIYYPTEPIEFNKKYFDKNYWLYFSKENYDLFYPSYGDTYPSYNGAIGMTYEQGGGGRAGLAIAGSGIFNKSTTPCSQCGFSGSTISPGNPECCSN
jgi:hypothetical protein